MRFILSTTALCCLIISAVSAEVADQRPPGLTGETWQFGPLNRWAYTHIREILPTKEIPNDIDRVIPIPGIEKAASDL